MGPLNSYYTVIVQALSENVISPFLENMTASKVAHAAERGLKCGQSAHRQCSTSAKWCLICFDWPLVRFTAAAVWVLIYGISNDALFQTASTQAVGTIDHVRCRYSGRDVITRRFMRGLVSDLDRWWPIKTVYWCWWSVFIESRMLKCAKIATECLHRLCGCFVTSDAGTGAGLGRSEEERLQSE